LECAIAIALHYRGNESAVKLAAQGTLRLDGDRVSVGGTVGF
jgi:hypothetical protein